MHRYDNTSKISTNYVTSDYPENADLQTNNYLRLPLYTEEPLFNDNCPPPLYTSRHIFHPSLSSYTDQSVIAPPLYYPITPIMVPATDTLLDNKNEKPFLIVSTPSVSDHINSHDIKPIYIERNALLHHTVINSNAHKHEAIFHHNDNIKQPKKLLNKESEFPLPRDMYQAVKNNDLTTIIEKLENNPELIYCTYKGNTLFHLAVHKNQMEILRGLLKRFPHLVDIPNSFAQTPLCLAAEYGQLQAALCLIYNHANLDLASISPKDHYAKTALYFAIEKEHTDIALLLIRSGAHVHHKVNKQKIQLIHLAAQHDCPSVIDELIKRYPELLNAKDMYNQTPLSFAAYQGKLETVKLLLKKGADINVESISEDKENGKTALYYSIEKDHEDVALELINYGAATDEVLVHLAAKFGHLKVLNNLLDQHPAWLEETCSDGKTPLMWALRNTQNPHKVVKLLLSRGANIYARDSQGNPVIKYLSHKDIKCKRLLTQANLYYKFNQNQPLNNNDHDKNLVIDYILTVLQGHQQRHALKNALDPNHLLHQRLHERTGLLRFLAQDETKKQKNKENFELALNKNRQKNTSHMKHDYPAMFAAREGNSSELQTVIEKDPTLLNTADHDDRTPLQMAHASAISASPPLVPVYIGYPKLPEFSGFVSDQTTLPVPSSSKENHSIQNPGIAELQPVTPLAIPFQDNQLDEQYAVNAFIHEINTAYDNGVISKNNLLRFIKNYDIDVQKKGVLPKYNVLN
jgi:ankyrin repeat protein